MTMLNNWASKAVSKMESERKQIPVIKDSEIGSKLRGNGAADAKASLMADAVLKAMSDFCVQNEAFAKAVADGGSFVDCMKAVAKGLGNYAEGPDICKKAIQFYIPGAEIEAQWKIIIPSQNGQNSPEKEQKQPQGIMLSLTDLFD